MNNQNEKVELIEDALIDSVSGGRAAGLCEIDICSIDLCEWPCFFQ